MRVSRTGKPEGLRAFAGLPAFAVLRAVRRGLAPLAALAVVGASQAAGAQISRQAEGADLQLHVDAVGTYLRTLPTMSLGNSEQTLGKRLSLGSLPSAGSGSFAGLAAGVGVTIEDHWVLPLLDFEVSGMVGRRPRVITAVEGSIASLEPWTAGQVNIFLFGFGSRWKHRRWMFELSAQPGVALYFMTAQVVAGNDLNEVTPVVASFALRGTLKACRRVDPDNRACLYAAPNLYDFGFFNGATFGLRWEFGP